jgi:hypothetical protein
MLAYSGHCQCSHAVFACPNVTVGVYDALTEVLSGIEQFSESKPGVASTMSHTLTCLSGTDQINSKSTKSNACHVDSLCFPCLMTLHLSQFTDVQ